MQQEEFTSYLSSEKRFSVHTITSYSNDISQFILFLLEEYQIVSDVSEVNFQMVRGWIASLLEKGVSPRSVNRKISTLKTYFITTPCLCNLIRLVCAAQVHKKNFNQEVIL